MSVNLDKRVALWFCLFSGEAENKVDIGEWAVIKGIVYKAQSS